VVPQPGQLTGFIERFSAVLITAGFPPMPARVFVTLLVEDSGRLSAAELAQRLQVSPAAVSGAVRYLAQLGMVLRVRVPGTRRDYYQMPDDVWHELLRGRMSVMERWGSLLREGIGLLPPGSAGRARLTEHADFIEFVTKEFPDVVTRWEQHRAAQHLQRRPLRPGGAGRSGGITGSRWTSDC
jgi:predicted transcriptional regulator